MFRYDLPSGEAGAILLERSRGASNARPATEPGKGG